MTAGRRLVPLLQQLADAGISINLISHSLRCPRLYAHRLEYFGNYREEQSDRPSVSLAARRCRQRIDQCYTSSRDVHPLGPGVFPSSHSATRKICGITLPWRRHSWGRGRWEDSAWWQDALLRSSPAALIATAAWNLANAEDAKDDVLSYFREAYDKKWWTFPSFLDNGFGPAIETLYTDYLPLTFKTHMTTYPQLSLYVTRSTRKRTVKANWDRLEKDILAEADALWQPCINCLRNGERPPEYTLLAPLNRPGSVKLQVAKDCHFCVPKGLR